MKQMNPRRYSLFVKDGKHYHRLSSIALQKASAVKVFQNALLAGSFTGYSMYLRPVKDDYSIIDPIVSEEWFKKVFPNSERF